jgi:hypothetical protein
MVKTYVKRLKAFEQQSTILRRLLVFKDFGNLYYWECGRGLSQEQFNAWLKQQDAVEVLVVVISWIKP